MANGVLEQILLEEHKRLKNGTGSSESTGLLNAVKTLTSARTDSDLKPAPPASIPAATAEKASTSAASTINKGYTLPAPQSPSPAATTANSAGEKIGQTALTIFTSGLGLMPLISGLSGLFGGGDPAAPQPLAKYAMPRPIQITAANSRGGGSLTLADYGQDGSARLYAGNSAAGGDPQIPVPQSRASVPSGQVVVNVQAMDSRSFLDHSQEIAQAVREAMLNMHALNDVVSEL